MCGNLETYWSPFSYTHKHTECIFKSEIELNLCISFHLEVYIFRENVLKASTVLLLFTSIDRRPSVILEKRHSCFKVLQRGAIPIILCSLKLLDGDSVSLSYCIALMANSMQYRRSPSCHVMSFFMLIYFLLYQLFSLKLNEASGVSLLLKPLKFLLNTACYHKLLWMPRIVCSMVANMALLRNKI